MDQGYGVTHRPGAAALSSNGRRILGYGVTHRPEAAALSSNGRRIQGYGVTHRPGAAALSSKHTLCLALLIYYNI
ncbi:hypothetical protein GDO81_018087 [Engystomops pustulosus]|uniref:Uncharacterized protein n=1 Tax=Engystomops pustulosus TaxID=76066 RepID=A0AAV7A534_ENGPU|nr:hypothetical protein GDO81_018087 [Engystomops pustulosus]